MRIQMSDSLARVIVGNIAINPSVVREFLKKSHYFMTYKPETETIVLTANHGNGRVDLLSVRNASYENAVKLAEGFGLLSDGRTTPLMWSKWNPIYRLSYDGSEDAERLRMEMLRLELPLIVDRGGYYNADAPEKKSWAWQDSRCVYLPPMWTVDMVIDEIRKDAARYKEQLASKP